MRAAVYLRPPSLCVSVERLEVVASQVAGDLLAEHRALVLGKKVARHLRSHYFQPLH